MASWSGMGTRGRLFRINFQINAKEASIALNLRVSLPKRACKIILKRNFLGGTIENYLED